MTGLGAEEIEDQHQARPDFNRGAGGEPLIQMPDGKSKRYARQSSHGDCLEDKSGLSNWLVAKGIEGASKDQSILARAIAASPYEDHKSDWTKLRQDAIQAGRGSYKADIGTAVHAMSERWEEDSAYDPGPKFRPALEAYSRVQNELGLKSQLIECQFVNDEFNTAGTADRLYELKKPLVVPTGEILLPGTLVIGDLKTGSSLEYSIPGYSVQLAGYAGGVLYDVVNNVRMPTPTINQRWAIIMKLSVDDATCDFLWVDLEIGRFGARLAEEVREWRRNWRRKEGYKATLLPVKVASDPEVEPEPEVEAFSDYAHMSKTELLALANGEYGLGMPKGHTKAKLIDVIEAHEAVSVPAHKTLEAKLEIAHPEDDLDAWIDYCRRRLDVIKGNDKIRNWALARWDSKVLVPPKAIVNLDQARALSKYLDRVEAEFGMQFVSGQPVPLPTKKESA
tara:strand:+ start:590 stop:1942 length:1353 start_codon:yes stop_codon:yes gene_type:complete